MILSKHACYCLLWLGSWAVSAHAGSAPIEHRAKLTLQQRHPTTLLWCFGRLPHVKSPFYGGKRRWNGLFHTRPPGVDA